MSSGNIYQVLNEGNELTAFGRENVLTKLLVIHRN